MVIDGRLKLYASGFRTEETPWILGTDGDQETGVVGNY